jgi:hypothetical protein
MSISERDVIPREDDREFLVECWKECLAKMIADVEETKRRWKDASQTVRAESLAAVADARAAFSEALIKLEHAIEERLGKLRQLVDEKNGPHIRRYEEGRVIYESELVMHEGSTYQALKDTGRAPPDDEHWICVAAGGIDGRSPRIQGTHTPAASYRRLDVVALNGSSFIAQLDDPGPCPGDGWQLIASAGRQGKPGIRGERGPRGPNIEAWKVDPESYCLTPVLQGGEEGPTIHLRVFFEQYHRECGP